MFFKKLFGGGPATPPPPSPAAPRRKPMINLDDARARHPGPEVPSPCISVCQMNEAKGFCSGCHRTGEEIGNWSILTDAERLDVWEKIESRQPVRR